MTIDGRRITLITRVTDGAQRDWNTNDDAPQRIIFVNALTVLRYTLMKGGDTMTHDVGRVIVDRAASPAEFLELLAELPHEFAGDVLLINETQAFLSATGRGGDRVLYSLKPDDVDFYLETHELLNTDRENGVRNPDIFRNPAAYDATVM